jgi:phosphatidylinositol alpha-mannosyltransferase
MYAESEGHQARAARRILANWMFHRFERGIAVSEPAAEYAGRVWTRPLEVIPNGVPTRTFHPPEDDAKAGLEGTLRLLFVGHWRDPRKGLPYLMEAHRRLRADGMRVHLDVVGAGTPGAQEQVGVTFHGPVTSETTLAEHYRRCDLFVAPATGQESFGIVLLEAMACARPMVCSDIPGYRQVADGAGARFVAPADVQGLAGAIADLARDPESRRRMGALNRSRAQAFDWDPIVGRIREQYLAAIVERRNASRTLANPPSAAA